MFTGIIEATGTIQEIIPGGSNLSFWIQSSLSGSLKIDQSVAHNGVCLTVDALADGMHRVTAIAETLEKTHLKHWTTGTTINLERCLAIGSRLDGHLVQGHVDSTGICQAVTDQQGSWLFRIAFPEKFAHLIIEKGSICLNGISLTAFDVSATHFSVAIIPYTWAHTNMQYLQVGALVNLEYDMVGKYIRRSLELQG
jgi:riboflavin synthase